jgi:hypothetical protein
MKTTTSRLSKPCSGTGPAYELSGAKPPWTNEREAGVSELLSRVHFGEVTLKTEGLGFFGDVYVGYASETYWMPSEFVGVVTEDGLMYRGRWREGPEFEKLSKAFTDDPRLVEVAEIVIKRRLNLFKREDSNGI